MTTSGRPVMLLLDLLSQRWTLRILWELHLASPAPLTFRALQERCEDMSSSVLNRRLASLREARIIGNEASGYALTDEGGRLLGLLLPLDAWARDWAASG
jgi:DNA-binding HxlR family transcriptional regulator